MVAFVAALIERVIFFFKVVTCDKGSIYMLHRA
jgi:hypothetical protein